VEFLPIAVGFVIAFAGLRVLLSRFGCLALDQPNERSLHERPVPRTGGIAVLAGAAVSLGFGAAGLWLPVALALVLAAVSFFDDIRGLPTSVRLAVHVAAAAFLVWHVLSPMLAIEMLVLILAVAWITNLYNFMDGADGLAGGMATIGFGAYGLAAWWGGDAALGALCVALSAAAFAFLLHNHHPARIFLGDVGSIPLGFLAAALGIVGWRNDLWPLWFPVMVFGPFIADATITLVRRVLRRERVWQAHRDHYYQRMVRMGLGHRGTAWTGYAVMLLCAGAALLGRAQAPAMQATVFLATSALLGAMAIWVDVRWVRFSRAQGPA
jgi:UDP-N-acetylmuramyl pentapeptide phosphotransferase/UDP-N-acetylglucosamine-1-phosphate transferase